MTKTINKAPNDIIMVAAILGKYFQEIYDVYSLEKVAKISNNGNTWGSSDKAISAKTTCSRYAYLLMRQRVKRYFPWGVVLI